VVHHIGLADHLATPRALNERIRIPWLALVAALILSLCAACPPKAASQKET
jgi:hypothetical protein